MPQDRDWADFLDRLIHDLREPLRSVHAFSEMLREIAPGRLGADGEEAVGEILSGTVRIRTLVDAISGFSAALREDAAPSAASLQLAFNLAVDALDGAIRGSKASVAAEDLPRVGVSLERAIQLLENLIGNSLKFRADAPPVVKVSARPEREGWQVQVEDNGIGIDPADCAAVFQPFARIHGRKYPGPGLGLTACRAIVEAHGGEIRLSPRPGGGSVCTFWLPAAQT